MKAIRVLDGAPRFVEEPAPAGAGVRVKIASSSICGSDLQMLKQGWVEGRILGHEFSGTTDDGVAVAVQPNLGCGHCGYCRQGYASHCDEGTRYLGVAEDGGMAEYVHVPESALFKLPSGIDLSSAALIEPLAVAAHALNRARVTERDRVLVVGAGAIGLASAAILFGRGKAFDISARHPHQQNAAQRLGGGTEPGYGYDVVVDAVGSSDSLADAVQRCKPLGRVVLVGSLWRPAQLDLGFCAKEVELIAATTYRVGHPRGEFHEAGKTLVNQPEVSAAMISHRFPLEAAVEAFAAAGDRAGGAIKVVFDL